MNKVMAFSVPIWAERFENIDCDSLCSFFYNWGKEDIAETKVYNDNGAHISSIGGRRTISSNIFKQEQMQPLTLRVEQFMRELEKELGFSDQKFSLHSGWVYFSGKNDYHNYHTHPDSYISCVFYAKVPKDCKSKILFKDPAANLKTAYSNGVREFSQIVTPPSIQLTTNTSEFVAFPSWLEHAVTPSFSEEERVAVVFNYRVVDYESN